MKGAWVSSPERKKAYINGTMRGSVAVLSWSERDGGGRQERKAPALQNLTFF
jgi:hypothetical protein